MPPTPSTGPISFLDIINEFGNLTDNDKGNSTSNPDPVKLGAYRTNVSYKSVSYPLDEGVPTGTSPISFSNLRGKRLNIIVKVHTDDTNNTANAKDLYDDRTRNISIVGNGREKKFKNSRIHIVVTGVWGSVRGTAPTGSTVSQSRRLTCAVRTGSWTASDGVTPTSVDLRVGGSESQSGYIIGGGGDGGKGGISDGETSESEAYKANGGNGCIGTSALGLDIPLRNLEVRSPGRIQAGCGGGGGGGGAGGELKGSNERAGGGGGGGGSGVPGGLGGAFGFNDDDKENSTDDAEKDGHKGINLTAQDGESGISNTGGDGGRGADNSEEGGQGSDSAQGGGGGAGGGIDPGEGGDATEGAESGAEGEEIKGQNDPDYSGEGGAGGDGDAEGQGQQTGTGGLGGQHGLAIDIGQNPIGSITGSDRIYGRYNLV